MKFLVETALLGHGLYSIKDTEILSIWPKNVALTWVEGGEIRIGDIGEFIHSRSNSNSWGRLDGLAMERNEFKDKNAFLTASGTMAVAKYINCPVVVTAGIGGISDIVSEPLSYDLPALSSMGITLVATSPKDMLDIVKTFEWLHQNGVVTYGINTKNCNGYLFKLEPYELNKELKENELKKIPRASNLILNPIPENKRLKDSFLLAECISFGKRAEEIGEYYHPAVNACFDKSSRGVSSRIQLESLIENICIAKKIID